VIELGLQDVVTMHGAQNGAFIRQLIDQAHLALLASVTVEGDQEGQGLVYRRRKRPDCRWWRPNMEPCRKG